MSTPCYEHVAATRLRLTNTFWNSSQWMKIKNGPLGIKARAAPNHHLIIIRMLEQMHV